MALDILHDNWGPYTHTEVENALKVYLTGLEGRINQAIQEGGVGLTDLSQEVRDLLEKANKALQPGDIAAWAKAQNKPGYTADEITGVEGFQNLLAKLQDMDQKIQAAAQSGVDPDDEMSSTSEKPVQNKVIKAYVDAVSQRIDTLIGSGNVQGAIDTFNEVVAFLNGINSSDTLAAKLALKANDADVVKGIRAYGSSTNLPKQDGIVTLPESQGGLTKEDISVETQGDGTVDINVKDDTYTINLNHTHEGMAKLVVCEESDLPSTLGNDTIYGVKEDGEIAMMYVAGLPFYGGGGGASSGPVLRRPADGATIDMGQTTSGTVSKTINVKGKNLTQALTIELDDTGYSFGTTQPSGVTRDSATQLTVTAAAANTLNGVDIVVVYTGSDTDENASGTLGITSASPDSISTEATLVANKVTYEDLAGVKLTGTQWLQTDYQPNPNTEFELDMKLETNANTDIRQGLSSGICSYILFCNTVSDNTFYVNTAGNEGTSYRILIRNTTPSQSVQELDFSSNQSAMLQRSILSYKKSGSSMIMSFNGVSATLPVKQGTAGILNIGYLDSSYHLPLNRWNLYIYSFKISENGVVVRNYSPVIKNGVPGLYDDVTDTFISSMSQTDELIPIYDN